MADELLASAWEQAERSEPPVRAAALLRIARVQTAFDHDQARKTFEQALDATRGLPGLDGQFLLDQARQVSAAVAPDLLHTFPPASRMPSRFASDMLGRIMLEHDQADAALHYVLSYDEPSTFPFDVASALMQRFAGEERRLAVFRRAIEAWRAAPDNRFIWLFHSQRKALPGDEAQAAVREIVRVTLQQPDQPTTSTYHVGGEAVRFTSTRENTLFQILDVLRHLDPPLAESLIAGHEQLAAGARRFPNGMESMNQEAAAAAAARKSASGESCSGSYVMAGNPRDFPYQKALMLASRSGDFGPLIEHALERFNEDTSPERPNRAPRTFWPSTCNFRAILYTAGKRLGPDAIIVLDRIPDADLRLFAQIELAAALAGLPEFQETQREHHPRPGGAERRARRAISANIRCPACNWSPSSDDRWSCRCGHIWNTFETGGLCPACRYQWKVTACHSCGESSPHSDWYVRSDLA
jgi:hypothetical protein